ncbi:MAG: LAGLIDADG family homing endonuclease, partial [Nanoarchaeota archaeon]|nr:LAGLIDADG family homing endonuclease [Nanoarchaeota archaeon]
AALFNLLRLFLLMNPQEAELIGAHVGDGTLYKTAWSLVWELRGDLKEREYYEDYLVPLLKSVFGEEFPVKFRSGGPNGCLGFQLARKSVTGWFLKQGFFPGKKSRTVRIPEKVMQGSPDIQYGFIRGLFDTDGCLWFDQKGRRNCYPQLEVCSASPLLIEDLCCLLNRIPLRHYTWISRESTHIRITGELNLHFWMRNIRPGNPKHSNKYTQFISRHQNDSIASN